MGTAEALGWAIAMGVVVGAVRVLAIRAATSRTRQRRRGLRRQLSRALAGAEAGPR